MSGNIIIVYETVYVDDIEPKTAAAETMQHRAHILSSIAIIFRIKRSDWKLRHIAMGEKEAVPVAKITIKGGAIHCNRDTNV